jgi:ADP-dependent NAD(P)H-hydrate dehydratase
MSAATAITAELLRRMPLPQPGADGDKDERGRVLVVAGSPEMPGGALLAGVAALRAGAGKLQIATAASIAPHLGLAVPEALVVGLPETASGGLAAEAAELLLPRLRRCDTILIGPGMLDEEAVAALATRLLDASDGAAVVLDAAALLRPQELREPLRRQGGRVVITPHAGEMARLVGMERREVVADPLGTARKAAALLQAVVALKGGSTHIVTPQGEAWVFSEGNVGLATSGSGDTLAGIIAGLLARGATPIQAAIWGVYLHGEAGNRLARARGYLGFLARELLAEVPGIMADLLDQASEVESRGQPSRA